MASAVRAAALRGSAALGAATLGLAYWQRVPRDYGDHRADWSESAAIRFYRTFVVPLIKLTDAETAHVLTIRGARLGQAVYLLSEPLWTGPTPLDWLLRPVPSAAAPSGPSLRQQLFGGRLTFDSPLGIAAGFDKNADLVPTWRLGALPGLGFSEVGSVSALPSEGNPQPRCFRLPEDEAVINRMGLNNQGADAIAEKMERFQVLGSASSPAPGGALRAPIGVNIAKTHSPAIMGESAVEDFVASFCKLETYADFVVLNVSCPNTAEGKTFEESETLSELLRRVGAVRGRSGPTPPVLVKLSPPPDNEEGRARLRTLVEVSRASGIVDGFVVSNTAGDRDVALTAEGREAAELIGRGGLSGRPLRARATAAIREVYRLTKGEVPIIGCGGVDSAESAYEKIRAGASLVELYTGLVYRGPLLFFDMHVGLRRLLTRDGFRSVSEAVGADVRAAA